MKSCKTNLLVCFQKSDDSLRLIDTSLTDEYTRIKDLCLDRRIRIGTENSIRTEQEYSSILLIFQLDMVIIGFNSERNGSFFGSMSASTFSGYLLGVLVFTSFEDWRFSHLRHHATYADLDARGFGDIWTMTRAENEASSKGKQLQYKLYRNPLVLIGLGAIFNFLLGNRLPTRRVKRKERMSVLFTNLLIVAVALAAAWLFGWRIYLLIQLPVLLLAGAAGIWLFYVQHQFEGGYWARKSEWEPWRAAMEGSSFYKLPAVLRWFSSNIGYHHVHHLSSRIPNYHLKNSVTMPFRRCKPRRRSQS